MDPEVRRILHGKMPCSMRELLRETGHPEPDRLISDLAAGMPLRE